MTSPTADKLGPAVALKILIFRDFAHSGQTGARGGAQKFDFRDVALSGPTGARGGAQNFDFP